MEKVAYIIDGASFLNEAQANEKGFHFIPLTILINGESYLEGRDEVIDLSNEIKNKKNISTSQPSPGLIIDLIDQLKKDGYDSAVICPIATGLSSTYENVIATFKAEGFKLHAIDSCGVGGLQIRSLEKVRRLYNNDTNLEEIVELVSKEVKDSKTYLLVDDLFHLSRSGRMTSAAATLGSLLKIKPILDVDPNQGGLIDVHSKVRTSKKAFSTMMELAMEDLDTSKYDVLIAHFDGYEDAIQLAKDIKDIYNIDVPVLPLCSIIGVHTGPNSVGIQVYPKSEK